MSRLTNRWTNGVSLEQYAYDAAGHLTNRLDLSGAYQWVYDIRGRLRTNATPAGTLFYQYDANGNLTNLASGTSGGASVVYQYDALNRITNVVDNGLAGTKNTAYTFDGVGNLRTLAYPNGVTNLWPSPLPRTEAEREKDPKVAHNYKQVTPPEFRSLAGLLGRQARFGAAINLNAVSDTDFPEQPERKVWGNDGIKSSLEETELEWY